MTVAASVATTCAALSIAVTRIFHDRLVAAATALVAATLLASVPFLLRATGSTRLAGHLLTGFVWLLVTLTNVATGGAVLGPLLASLVIPLLGLLLLEVRAGVIWGLLAVAQAGLTPLLIGFGYTPPVDPPPAVRDMMLLVAPPVATLLVLALALAFRRLELRALDELGQARDEAQAANVAKTLFLASMSHELRTPMNGIVGALTVLTRGELTDEQRKYSAVAMQSAETLLSLIGNVLDLAQVEAGTLTIESRAFELGREVRDATEALGALAERSDLELRTVIAADADLKVLGDRARIRQLVTNLVGNALKFTVRGHVEVRLSLVPPGRVQLEVEDTGPGITPDLLPHIFEAHTRGGSSVTGVDASTGLGLAIVREVCTAMGGEVGVETVLAQGTTFRVELPFELAPVEKVDKVPTREEEHGHVLLAEDNRINQMVLVALLEQLGHRVSVANNGLEAVSLWEEGAFDWVLMDRQMPQLDGLAATEKIRVRERELGRARTPIIALTASALRGDHDTCLAAGMDDFLTKPVDAETLVVALRRHLRARA